MTLCMRLCLCGLLMWSSVSPVFAQSLMTRWAKDVRPEAVHQEYPRPQLTRDKWLNLNGQWNYAIRPFRDKQPEADKFDGKVLVPFPVESALSGVKKPVGDANRLWYRRTFTVPADWRGQSIRLHFGAVDWDTTVFMNGKRIGGHKGGYDPFSFELNDALKPDGEQELVVRVSDPTDSKTQPRGKQIKNPHGIWYTPVTGIWQTIWIEPVPATRIESLQIVPDRDLKTVRIKARVTGASAGDQLRVSTKGAVDSADKLLTFPNGQAVQVTGDVESELALTVPVSHPWTPDEPFLYPLTVDVVRDQKNVDSVGSYFGLRSIEAKKDERGILRMFLNGKSLFQYGPLDQGWWPDGLYTAPTDAALKFDIEITKKLGFNMARKHVKVEPDRWYYWADKLGLLVWQDMPSGMATGRPQGIPPGAKEDATFTEDEKDIYRREWAAIMDARNNHPCIVVWVPFNEGWGQHDTNAILKWTKERDISRLVGGPSGWEDRGFGDLKDMHLYPGPGMFPVMPDRVSVLGEFGGLGLPVEGHTWLDKNNWGYRNFTNKADLQRNYERLIRQLPDLTSKGLAAAVYTQTTDVEIEVNGLLTYDREVVKFDTERLAKLHKQLYGKPPSSKVILPTAEAGPQKWRMVTTKPADGWQQANFEDANWKEVDGGIGGETPPNTFIRSPWKTPDIWVRRSFELDPSKLNDPHLRIYHDEDCEVFINGEKVVSLTGYVTQYFNEPLGDARKALKPGRNVIAIHCHQTGGGQYIDAGLVDYAP